MTLETKEKLIRFILDVLRYIIATGLGYWGGSSDFTQTCLNIILTPNII